MKINNIFWSGGFDSTALLLSKIKESLSSKESFRVISVVSSNIKNSKSDKSSRDNIKKYLYSSELGDHIRQYFSFKEIEINNFGGQAGQSFLWAMLCFDGMVQDEKLNVYFGYVRGDDFYHNKSNILDMYKSFSKMYDVKIKAHYPFEWYYKNELVYIYSEHRKIFDLISWDGDLDGCKMIYKKEFTNILNQIEWSKGFSFKSCEVEPAKKDLVQMVSDIKENLLYGNTMDLSSLENPS